MAIKIVCNKTLKKYKYFAERCIMTSIKYVLFWIIPRKWEIIYENEKVKGEGHE